MKLNEGALHSSHHHYVHVMPRATRAAWRAGISALHLRHNQNHQRRQGDASPRVHSAQGAAGPVVGALDALQKIRDYNDKIVEIRVEEMKL